MLWRSSLVVCVVSASLIDTGCSIYDHNILENAKQRARDHMSESDRNAAREVNLSEFLDPSVARVDDAGTGVTPDDSNAETTLNAHDAGSTQGTSDARAADDDDSGALSERADADIPDLMPEASPACRGRIGYVSQSGRCYFVFATPLSWHQSRDECRNLGAQLATITSEREQKFVASFQTVSETWIGLSKFGASSFSWLSNEELSFTNWEPEAPRPSQESAVVIVPGTSLWSDRAPHELHPSLCEIEKG